MTRKTENTGFMCLNCGETVLALTNGSYRNHCPFCLHSLHVDTRPGDRANSCRALMAPVGVVYKAKKGWQIIHRCMKCSDEVVNKIATDTVQPDDYGKLADVLCIQKDVWA